MSKTKEKDQERQNCLTCKYLIYLCSFLGIIIIIILIMFLNYSFELSDNKIQFKKVIEITNNIETKKSIPSELKEKILKLKEIINKKK